MGDVSRNHPREPEMTATTARTRKGRLTGLADQVRTGRVDMRFPSPRSRKRYGRPTTQTEALRIYVGVERAARAGKRTVKTTFTGKKFAYWA
jgi:hypothetical protein